MSETLVYNSTGLHSVILEKIKVVISSVSRLLLTSFSSDLHFVPENGGGTSPETSVNIYQNTRRYILEDIAFHTVTRME
jgi:hypothetical protein